jgi:hypothetical protein
MTWRDHLPIHKAADLFAAMSREELRELGDDIAKYGLRTPVILWSNSDDDEPYEALLDGRSRLDAAEQAGLLSVDDHGELRLRHPSGDYVPILKSYSRDDDPYAIVLACNLLRRHLKPEERQGLLIKLIARRPEWSNRQIAKEAGVNRKAVDRARAKGEDVGQVAHVSKRVDSTGRKQSLRAKPKPKSVQLAEAVVTRSARALADFKFAADTYLPRMDANDLEAARQHFNDVCGKHERADGARATGQQLSFQS